MISLRLRKFYSNIHWTLVKMSIREYLVKHKYAARGKVAINGGSNGGEWSTFGDPLTWTPDEQTQDCWWLHVSTELRKGCWVLLLLKSGS